MRRLLFILLCLPMIGVGQNVTYDPKTGINREYSYDNKLIFQYKTDKYGEYNGYVKSWYENGNREYIQKFSNGTRVGVQKYWNEEGILIAEYTVIDWDELDETGKETVLYSERIYKNALGEPYLQEDYGDTIDAYLPISYDSLKELCPDYNEGETFCNKLIIYYENGKKHYEILMNALGVLAGSSKEWYSNGQIKLIQSFKNGRYHGEHKGFFQDGSPMFQFEFREDFAHHLQKNKKEWYENGQLKKEGQSEWYTNGQLKTDGHSTWYTNGQLKNDRRGKSWHENGQLECEYGEGLLNIYNQDGKLIQERTKEGYRQYYDNGNVAVEINEVRGDGPHGGVDRLFHENGTLLMEYDPKTERYIQYDKDGKALLERNSGHNGIYREYYNNNQLKLEGQEKMTYEEWRSSGDALIRSPSFYAGGTTFPVETYKNHFLVKIKDKHRNGDWISYYKSGQKQSLTKWRNGRLLNEKKSWHENGALCKEVTEGITSEWNSNGDLIDIKLKRDGEFKLYYSNGKLRMIGSVKNRKRDGLWQEWYETGGLKSKGIYKEGVGFGLIQEWYEDGILKKEEKYQDYADNTLIHIKEFYEDGQIKCKRRWDILGSPKFCEQWYKNGKLKSKDKYTYLGEYKSSKCWDEKGKKTDCVDPILHMKNFYQP